MEIRAEVLVSGFVQGIGYRAWTKKKAEALGLKGWVMNLKDGSVKAVLEGKQEKVRKMIELMKKGPAFARVEKIDYQFFQELEGFNDFKIKYS